MSKHKNVLEINGRVYDVRTGVPIRGQSVDGFVQPRVVKSVTTKASPAKVSPQRSTPTLKPKPVRQHVSHSVKHHKPQKSKTLMRRAVKKPATLGQINEIKPIHRQRLINPLRETRAQTIAKSPYISKFGNHPVHRPVEKRHEPLQVKTPPAHKPRLHQPITPVRHTEHATVRSSASEELFNKAMQRSAEATKPAIKSRTKRQNRKSKKFAWSSGLLAGLALIGFIAYMNIPNFNMQLASARAGFDANLPEYQPSGYKVKAPISYKPGQVVISFNSNTDDRAYTLTQEVSHWNSSSLQENFLATNDKEFEIEQEKGKTIYLYDRGNATWVNGGVWYRIESTSLSSDQLVNIASSL